MISWLSVLVVEQKCQKLTSHLITAIFILNPTLAQIVEPNLSWENNVSHESLSFTKLSLTIDKCHY